MKISDLQSVNGKCQSSSVVKGEHYRFTILTSQLVRMEYSANGIFEDRISQMAINRNFATPDFKIYKKEEELSIETKWLSIHYNQQVFSPEGLWIKVRSNCKGIRSSWRFGDLLTESLGGTVSTLDMADGEVALEPGLQSHLSGFGVIDDSGTLILSENGWIEQRQEGTRDIYFFGYGHDYKQCLKDYFHLSGKTPLLPRFALGNWWSRFYPYTDQEYEMLMERFARDKIPFSIAVLDMDWHITEVESSIGKGWTGYTWNGKLFPDPITFLRSLHTKKLKVALNLHPAEGIQSHEEMYPEICQQMNVCSPQSIDFDFCDQRFVEIYFSKLHHPKEKQGVDFWWIDWQQGDIAKLKGAHPNWLLNHFHFLDSAKQGKRPLILSRYAGFGGHRYPIGFSGDTVVSWASLNFQPFFTATATNVGFGWWSHDIGGHTGGEKDEELMVRWLQFGVFSPILRLHSTSNLFNGKQPWNFSLEVEKIMQFYLRFRHRLIPYLYTMNWLCHYQDELLIRPMYYEYPDLDQAYEVPNQYQFGSELIVCPITKSSDPKMKLGKVEAWLPEGIYHDIFTGMIYDGNRYLRLYRTLDHIPILAKGGGIVPLASADEAAQNGVELPKNLEVEIFGGNDGQFVLYEDDGESLGVGEDYEATCFTFQWRQDKKTYLTLSKLHQTAYITPEVRNYIFRFNGVLDNDNVKVNVNQQATKFSKQYDANRHQLIIELQSVAKDSECVILFEQPLMLSNNDVIRRVFETLNVVQLDFILKEKIYRCISELKEQHKVIGELQMMELPSDILGALLEILLARKG